MTTLAMENAQICADYLKQKSRYQGFCKKVAAHLEEILKHEALKYHSITYRAKDENSLRLKLERVDGKYRSLEQVTDLAGIRVVTYYADEVDSIAKLLEREFEIDKENTVDKRQFFDPDRFGYVSMHYIIQVKESSRRFAKYAPIKAEVQIRSILQHTWAEIEHDLGYKNTYGIPKEIKRDFFRLAGILELADKEFKEIRENIKEYSERVSRQMRTKTGEIVIDYNSVELYIRYNANVHRLNNALLQGNISYFKEDAFYAVSIVNELLWVGFRNIGELDRAVEENYVLTLAIASQLLRGRGSHVPLDRSAGLFYLCYAVLAKERNPEKFWRFWLDNKIISPESGRREGLQHARRIIAIYTELLADAKKKLRQARGRAR
jgi:ppGpp synthetase/RelA/SpoT-type nucleotidyltranferase